MSKTKAKSNDPPHAVVELDRRLYDFLIHNCDVNIAQTSTMIDPCGPMRDTPLSRSTTEKLVNLIEDFRELKRAAERGVL